MRLTRGGTIAVLAALSVVLLLLWSTGALEILRPPAEDSLPADGTAARSQGDRLASLAHDPSWSVRPREGAAAHEGAGVEEAPAVRKQTKQQWRRSGRRHRLTRRQRAKAAKRVARDAAAPEAQPEEDFAEEETRQAPIVRFGERAPEAPTPVDKEKAIQMIVAIRRLRDSGVFRRLTPAQLPHVLELMPESQGVQDADRILRQEYGIGVEEFLAQNLNRGVFAPPPGVLE